jgi:hypothetical protein
MGLLDAGSEEPKGKALRYAITGITFVVLVSIGVWFFVLRFSSEKRTVAKFMDALVAGDTQQAYKIWNPHGDFTYEDFLNFWGPKGYYSPIKSYQIERAHLPPGSGDATGVEVIVELSAYPTYPPTTDAIKTAQSREVEIWVESSDKSMSFPPP